MEASDRLVPIVDHLVRALHQVVEEHRVTEPELRQALQFLAEVGAADEWVLLSDVLGISVAVDNQTYRREGDETPANVQGPFYRPGAPLAAPPVSLCRDDEPGDPCFVAGRVLAAGDRRPLEGALLDVWQTNQAGLYDHEDPDQPEWNLRRRFHAGADGAYEFRTVVPGPYEIPKHGPVGRLLAAVGRHAWRPAHFHVKVGADGFRPLTTMIYLQGDPWLHDDTISSVKPGLVVELAAGSSTGCGGPRRRRSSGCPQARAAEHHSTAELHARMLVRADPAPVQPMRCLSVDSPNSMFLVTPWCIPTHNTMFGAPSEWTPVSKTCPGTIRIRRFSQTVLPAIVAGSTGGGGLSVADANSLERHLDVIQRKVETTFNQVNSNDAALSSELDGISAQVSQADMTGSSRRSASPRPEGRPARAGYLGPRCSRNQSRAAPLAASNALT